MKSYLTIIIWTLGGLGVGLYSMIELNANFPILVLFTSIGAIIGFVHSIVFSSASGRKEKIFKQIVIQTKGKLNDNGLPEFDYNGFKVICDYNISMARGRVSEAIIPNIDITSFDKGKISKADKIFEVHREGVSTYIRFYCPWGYQGQNFTKCFTSKMNILSKAYNSK